MLILISPRLLGTLVALLFLGACAGAKPDSMEEETPVQTTVGLLDAEKVGAVLRDALDGRPAPTYAALLDRLGPPVRTKAMPTADRDTLRTAIYYGLEVIYHEGTAALTAIAFTDPRFASPEGLRVGHAEDHVRQTLGRPTRQESTLYFYELSGPPPVVLVVILDRGAVGRIEWRF